MSLQLAIAGFTIHIRGAQFVSSLNAAEMLLLRPFIIKQSKLTRKGVFVVEMMPFVRENLNVRLDVNFRLQRTLRSLFNAKTTDKRFKPAFKYFCENYSPLLLKEFGVDIKKYFTTLLKDTCTNNIMIGEGGSVLCFGVRQKFHMYYLDRDSLDRSVSYKHLYNLRILRWLLRAILGASGNGIMIHASSVNRKGFGYVFAGRSGSGKSTVAKMLGVEKALSDDIAIVRRTPGGYRVFPNPWWNLENYPSAGPTAKGVGVRAIFFIRKSKKTALKRLSFKKSLEALLFRDYYFQWREGLVTKKEFKRFYLFLLGFIKKIQIFELNVKKCARFREELDAVFTNELRPKKKYDPSGNTWPLKSMRKFSAQGQRNNVKNGVLAF